MRLERMSDRASGFGSRAQESKTAVTIPRIWNSFHAWFCTNEEEGASLVLNFTITVTYFVTHRRVICYPASAVRRRL
jgi:hypothetical protein